MRRALAPFLALAILPCALAGQSDVRVLRPVADSRVSEGSPGSNSGADTALRVRASTGASYRSYLRFDLGSVESAVSSARLRLYCTDASPNGGALHALADTGWSETGLTWGNQPALSAAFAPLGAVAKNAWVELDVTAALGGGPTQVFALAGGSSNSAYYSSREGSNPPELVLELAESTNPPEADFSGTPRSGAAPLAVSFTDLSSGAPTSWLWSFGDGGTSTAENPVHVYSQPGTFTVRLDVANAGGSDSLTRTGYVTVQAPLPAPNLTFLPVADARVNLTSPTRNFGTDGTLRVRGGSEPYHSYLRFEPTVSGPVTSALLRLFVTDESPVGGIAFATSNAWNENTITWSNKPATIGSALASAGSAPAGSWVTFDVTAAITGPGPVSFALQSSSSNSCYFSSREGANPPQLLIASGPAAPPDAAFSGSPLSGSAPLSVAFSNLSTNATSWLWTFGDGTTSTARNPAHVYTQSGTYTVRLDVSGPGGSDSHTRSNYVSVSAAVAPEASFSGTPRSGAAPLSVSFTDLSTGATSWLWSFGDGTTSTARNPAHVYAQSGSFTVRLDVSGPGGSDSLTRSGYVSVSAGTQLEASFSATPVSGMAPLTVSFTDLSSGSPTGWLWSFGDGASSSQRSPVHTYDDPGTYSVTLTVTRPGASDTFTSTNLVRVLDSDVQGIWTSAVELSGLPMNGDAWENVLDEADRPALAPLVAYQGDGADERTLAKALVFARTGNQRYRQEVIATCMAAIGTEVGGRTLDLARNLVGYVVAADLVGLPSEEDQQFRAWLRHCRTVNLDGRSLISTHEDRPNNWGTAAGASRVAVAVYLGETSELERCAQVFHGWLGNRSVYDDFDWGELDWQADPARPVAINPAGATRDGHSIDGVLPDDQRRSGGFVWPPPQENYVWEALQGALVQAVILHRAGYDVWEWEDQALLRAARWLHEECDFPATGDDEWLPHIVNHYYGTSFPAPVPANPGKSMGWTDWTHGS